jgi:hypothetical protein
MAKPIMVDGAFTPFEKTASTVLKSLIWEHPYDSATEMCASSARLETELT